MFDKLTKFLTLACLFSAALSAPTPQNTGSGNAVGRSDKNLQPFTGALGGAVAPSVSCGDNRFTVEGDESFDDLASALARSCDILETECINFANSGAGMASGLTVAECEHQNQECRAAIAPVSNTATCPIVARADEPQGTPQGANPGNVQTFTGALGGQPTPAVTRGDNGFQVKGGATFTDLPSALRSSCDMQKQRALKAGVPVAECDKQEDQCLGALTSAPPASGAKPPSLGKRQDTPSATNLGNAQTFSGALGGQPAPAVTRGDNGFQVKGGATFTDLSSALRSSCDVQKQRALKAGVPVAECNKQEDQCLAAVPPAPLASGAKPPSLGKRQGTPPANNGPSTTNARIPMTPGNIQTFGGALGGQNAPAVIRGNGGFQVEGGNVFADFPSALRSSCDVQKETAINAGLPVAACDEQHDECIAAITSTPPASGAKPPALGKRQDSPSAANAPLDTTFGNAQTLGGAVGGQRAPANTPVGGGSRGAMLPDVADRPVNNQPLPADGALLSPKGKTPPPPAPARIGNNGDNGNTATLPGGLQPFN